MTDQDKPKDRDWDQEMRDVDRLLAKLPYAETKPSAGAAPTQRNPAAGARGLAGPTVAGTWIKAILGVLLGVGMTQWPYSHGCGLRLIFFLVGVAAVLAAGTWTAISSWRRRMGFVHFLSHLLIIWGTVLAARELFPRVGAEQAAIWLCPDVRPVHH